MIKGAIYQHYKGNKYYLLDIAKGSEDDKLYAIYKQLPNDISDEEEIREKMCEVRPAEMWDDEVEVVDGCKVPRFKLICIVK